MTLTLDSACASAFTGEDPQTVHADLLSIVEAAITHQPRSLQTRIGPSELGNPCDRCLAHKLGGTPEAPEVAWLPFVGTCVHEELETILLRHEATRASLGLPGRFLPENRVTVGQVGGIDITGSTDLFDTHTGTVIDYKVVGAATLKTSKAHGAKAQYRTQAHLYGKGWEDAGYPVRSVLVWFMPRNAITLRQGHVWQEPYDRSVAEKALAHADRLAKAIQALGLPTVLSGLPPHITDDGQDSFSCRRYPDYAAVPAATKSAAAHLDPSDPFGSA